MIGTKILFLKKIWEKSEKLKLEIFASTNAENSYIQVVFKCIFIFLLYFHFNDHSYAIYLININKKNLIDFNFKMQKPCRLPCGLQSTTSPHQFLWIGITSPCPTSFELSCSSFRRVVSQTQGDKFTLVLPLTGKEKRQINTFPRIFV